jgi:hypothetical protein
MLATINLKTYFLVAYLKTYKFKYTELQWYLFFFVGVKLGFWCSKEELDGV